MKLLQGLSAVIHTQTHTHANSQAHTKIQAGGRQQGPTLTEGIGVSSHFQGLLKQ